MNRNANEIMPKRRVIMLSLAFLLALLLSITACTNTNDSAASLVSIEESQESASEPAAEILQEPTSELTIEEPTPPDESIESDIAQRVLYELTKPEHGGRVTGSDGLWQATQYLAGVFEDIGLNPWDNNSFIMTYPNPDTIRLFSESMVGTLGHNIVGVIPGKDRTRAVIVTAHYDSIGGGDGALDNASGVATMLRVAESLMIWGEQPETDIIFCAFDGEEFGLIGSTVFAPIAAERYVKLYNINIDTVGLQCCPLTIDVSNAHERNRPLRMELTEILAGAGIDFDDIILGTGIISWFSDNEAFDRLGFSNITLGTFSDMVLSTMHSERDVSEVLDITLIKGLADVITEFIISGQGKMY